MERLGITTKSRFVEVEDLERAKSATRKTSNKEKDWRKKIDDIRRREREQGHQREGAVHGAGQF